MTANICKKKLLIIDDDRNYRTTLRFIFHEEYSVLEATNGKEGFSMAKENNPDIILCDVVMPLEDGYKCCFSLKKYIETCFIPIIMLTSKNSKEDILQGLRLGIDDYITKPCNLCVLKIKVYNLIKNREIIRNYYSNIIETGSENDSEFINSAIEIIEHHMGSPDFGVKQLAEMLFISPTSLYRKTKIAAQTSPNVLIRKVRLRKAAKLLKTQALSVIEVAEAIGYNDVSSFRKHFAGYFGMTPCAYAKI